MKKINRSNMTLIASGLEGDLYSCYSVGEEANKPIIFIRDQITNRFHPAGFPYGLNFKLLSNDVSNNYYDECSQKPYVWVYKYLNKLSDREAHNVCNNSRSLMIALEESKIKDADIVGEGLGGVIGILSSYSSRVDRIVALHPPILSSPLGNIDLLKRKANTYQRKLVLMALKRIIDDTYGYSYDSLKGFRDLSSKGHLKKVKVVGSSIVGNPSISNLDKILSDYIYDCTGVGNDGVVLWDANRLSEMGFLVQEDEEPISHIEMLRNPEYKKDISKKLILK